MTEINSRPGRRTLDGAVETRSVSVALTREQRAWLKDQGGSVWVRAAINAAMKVKPPSRGRSQA